MNIYYSRSNEVKDCRIDPLLEMFYQNLPNKKVMLTKHKRGDSYDPSLLDKADLVLVGTTDLQDTYPEIAKGCYSELHRAFEAGIPVAVFWEDGEHGICLQTVRDCDVETFNTDTYQLGYGHINLYDDLEDVCGDVYGCRIVDPQHVEDFLVEIYGLDKFNELFHPEYSDIKEDLSKPETAVVNGTTFHVKIGSDKTVPANRRLLLLVGM